MSEPTKNPANNLIDLESLFRANYKSLCYLSYKIVSNKETAEDIVQDCFFKFWEKKAQILIKTSLKAYLYRSVTNASLNHVRFAKKYSGLENVVEKPEDDLKENSPDDLIVKVQQAIETLPPKCKTIFILSRYQGLKYKEIADVMQISIKTVENQMGIAFEKLRDKLQEFSSLGLLLLYLLHEICNYTIS